VIFVYWQLINIYLDLNKFANMPFDMQHVFFFSIRYVNHFSHVSNTDSCTLIISIKYTTHIMYMYTTGQINTFYSSNNPGKKCIKVSTKILSSTTILNCDNNIKMFQHIRMISEGSCDTEELKIQLCITGINYI